MIIGKQTKDYREDNFTHESKKYMELTLTYVKNNYLRYISLCPDYPVVHLQHLMMSNPTVWSGIMPDNPVLRHDTYTDWSRLDGRAGVCVMAFSDCNSHSVLGAYIIIF